MTQRDQFGRIPPDAMMTAKAQAAALPAVAGAGGLDSSGWEQLGPGNIGGRVRAVAPHPTVAGTIFCGSVSGGLWKTTNNGASWSLVDDLMTNLAITGIVYQPGNPSIMYACTGEGFFNGDAIRGAGIFKSTDGGTTWSRLPSTANATFHWVNRLAISPDGNTLLAATLADNTPGGIHRSTDGGATWAWALGSFNAQSTDVDFHPTNSNIAVADLRDYDFGINSWRRSTWFSSDGGVSWARSTGNDTMGFFDRCEIAFQRGWTGGPLGCVYCMKNNEPNKPNGTSLLRSLDGGATFTLLSSGLPILGNQGWYAQSLWIDPSNPNANPADDVMVAGGLDLWRSTDGGATFTIISQWFSEPISAHADQQGVAEATGFDGVTNKAVLFGNDGGIYRADDVYTVTQLTGWTNLNNALGITQFYGASRNNTSGTMIGGLQDNGVKVYKPANGANAWTYLAGGDGGFCASDTTDPNFHYGEYVYLQLNRSSDGANTYQDIYANLPDAGNGNTALFIAPFILDPNNQGTMYAGGASLWRSTDVRTAATFTSVKVPTGTALISAIAVAEGNADIIWVGYNNGEVWYTTNGTAATPTWTTRHNTSPVLPGRYVTRITIDARNASRVFVTFGGFATDNIWQSTDSGANWAAATGLPAAPVRDVEIHRYVSSWLYAATEVGLLVSEDNGVSWTSSVTPSTVSIDELFTSGNHLYLATHGRGVYRQSPFITGTATPFGTGCPTTSGTPALAATNAPAIGVPFTTRLSGIGTNTGIFLLGVSNTQWGQIPLPLALGQYGFGANCTAYTSMDLTRMVAPVNGAADLTFMLPNVPELYRTRIFIQGATVDNALADPVPVAFSNALDVTFGI